MSGPPTEPRPRTTVDVVGKRRIAVEADANDRRLEPVERRLAYECHTGGRIGAEWRGLPVSDLLDAVDAPDGTTHLAVTATDGVRACVPLSTALDGLLAFERDGRQLPAPRFVAPGIDGPRAVKRVRRVEAVELAPGEDKHAHEHFLPVSDDGDS